MDGVKKNLHFIVLGAGVLLGLVLMVVGIMIKSGRQQDLGKAAASLPKAASLPTKRDSDNIKRMRESFDKEIATAEESLRSGAGAQLRSGRTTFTDGASFFSQEGDVAVKALQARFVKLEKPATLPAELGDRTVPPPQNQPNYWGSTLQQMNSIADPKKIPEFQTQIRIMSEVCFICEQLLKQPAFAGQGIKLVEFKWEFRGMENVSIDVPWEDFPFVVTLECQPGFATALAEELSNPSRNTLGEPAKAKENLGRWGFPIEVDGMQLELMERPIIATANISNADKAKYGIPENAKDDDPVLMQKKKELEEKWFKDLQLQLPVRAAIRAKALSFNKNWRGVTPPPENN